MAAPNTTSLGVPIDDSERVLDVSVLKELARKALVDALNAVSGAKTLVLDQSISGPLGLVTEVSLLKQHGVEKMFWLESGPLSSTTTSIVYLCRPLIKHVKVIADQIKRHARENQKHTYNILLVPRVSTLITRVLEEEGVLGDVTLSAYNLQFIPLAEDVISLEYENAFKEIWVDGDETAIYNSSQALLTLQKLYGLFPRILGKGDHAGRLATLLKRSAEQATSGGSENLSKRSDKMDCLVIIDRRTDMITPLLTQLTYEGLIDEVLGVTNSHVQLPASLLTPSTQQPNAQASSSASGGGLQTVSIAKEQKKKYHLSTATDPLLEDLRDLNFMNVGRVLNKNARRIDEEYKARNKAKTVTELKTFVGKLSGLQSEHHALSIHTGISDMIAAFTKTEHFNKSLEIQQNLLALYDFNAQVTAIEEMIAQGADMQTVLRLICLASLINGGIKTKPLDSLRREFLQSYGYIHLPLLLALARPPLQLILPIPLPQGTPPPPKFPYTSLRKQLRLLHDDSETPEELENDIAYVYSGFAPLSVRLVQCAAQKGGVLSTPAGGAAAQTAEGQGEEGRVVQARAHPIIGWKGFEDVLAMIPGETVDIVQLGGAAGATAAAAADIVNMVQNHEQTKTTVVFFLGGCTYTEIAALRWVGRQNRGRKFLIATTGIITGRSLVESMTGVKSERAGAASKDAGL